MTAQIARWLPIAFAAVLAGGCDGVIDPSQNQVEERSGIMQPLGTEIHQFSVSKSGEFEVRITALSNADAILLMAYGPQAGGCTGVTLGSAYRQLNQIGFGGLIQPGQYCVYLQDEVGTLRGPTTYTLRISHP